MAAREKRVLGQLDIPHGGGGSGGLWPKKQEGQLKRTVIDVLLVRKHQQQAILHLSIVYDAMELLSRLVHSSAI